MASKVTPQPTVQVIPIPLTDQQKPVDNIRTRVYFFVPQQLNEGVLRSSLDNLVRNHWRKLGSRLVERPKDKLLEYHLPSRFPDDYTLFNWSCDTVDKSIQSLGVLPKATPAEQGLTLHPPLDNIDKVFLPSHWPRVRKDEPPDSPLLWIHVSLFNDGSALTISCPHVLADQLGLANILKAWFGIAEGNAPPEMQGYDSDVLVTESTKSYSELGKEKTRRHGRSRVMTGFERTQVILGLIPELVLNPKEVHHLIFLPHSVVSSLREKHTNTLVESYGENGRLSNGDVISSILCKLVHLHRTSNRKVNFSATVNARGRLPQLERDSISFIHNARVYGTTRLRINSSTPLAEIAYHLRLAIIEATDPEDIEVSLAISREQTRKGQGLHICEPFERSYNVSNWTAAWKGINFGPVLEGSQDNGMKVEDVLVLGLGLESEIQRFSSYILSKTDEGYWCTCGASKKTFKAIEKYLAEDPRLERF